MNNDFASAEHKVKDRQELLTWHRVRKQLAATVEILRVAVTHGFKSTDFNGIYDQHVRFLEVEPCAENPAPTWVRAQRHESRVNTMPLAPGFWKFVASGVMPKHGYSEADVGAAQIRLVSHRIATISSSADSCIGALTEFVKSFRVHGEGLKNDAVVSDIGCIERLLGYQSAEIAESCASNLEETCRMCRRLDASLMLKSLCMFPALIGQS